MKKINLYFAGSMDEKSAKKENEIGVKNRLLSFQYKNLVDKWFFHSNNIPGKIIIDSGAFSVWNKGEVIDINQYLQFAHSVIEKGKKHGKDILIVNLDVIPGNVGETKKLNTLLGSASFLEKNKDLVESAALQGFKNMKFLISNGIKPIHVFHQGEHWKWLDRMLNHVTYIGISPANDLSVTDKRKWIYSVFNYLYKNNIDVDTHGFAAWIPSLLKDLPWTSCDAASWKLSATWGNIYYPKGGLSNIENPTFDKDFKIINVSEKRIKSNGGIFYENSELENNIKIDPHLLSFLEKDGYSYEDLQEWRKREEINIKFFLLFEKWLNKHKEKNEFKPKNKLL